MASIFDIPLELFDRILELTITTYSSPPENPEVAGEYMDLRDMEYRTVYQGANLLYPKSPEIWDASSLLLANQKLRSRTLAALGRINTTFELDVMLVEGYQLWATWLCVPNFSLKADRIHASFRVFPKTKPNPYSYSGFTIGNGAPLAIYWPLYSLLERSLKCGPSVVPGKQENGFESVQVLDLDVLTPTETPDSSYRPISEYHFCDKRLLKRLGEEQVIEFFVTPELWLETISQGIRDILDISSWNYEMGDILYERIGTIRILRDGEVKEVIDLADHLSKMIYSGATDLYRKRQDAGLPVVPFVTVEE